MCLLMVNGGRMAIRVKVRCELVGLLLHEDDVAVRHEPARVVDAVAPLTHTSTPMRASPFADASAQF